MIATGSVTLVTAKREVKTSVIVGDGETIILGGIVKETEKSLRRRVPGLSYIPLIGSLFQKVSKEKEKIDFIIFLTPQIISDAHQMRQATLQASGVPSSADLMLSEPVSTDRDIELSPVETEVDHRFHDLYRDSLKRR